MERASKWLLLALVVVEVALVQAGLLDLGTAIGVVVAIELLLLLVAGRQIVVAVRRYRQERAAGLDIWAALEDGLAALLPRPVARMAALEPRHWYCLWQWALRRHRLAEGEFSYRKRSIVGAFLVVILFTTPVELLLLELLIPWGWLRWALLVLALYALFWAFGFYASLVVLPHRLEARGVRLRYGTLAAGFIPYEQIAGVELEGRRAPGLGDGLQLAPSGKKGEKEEKEGTAYLAVGGRTDVTLRLRAPLALHGVLRPTAPVATVRLAADEPERLVRELALRVAPG